MDTLSAFAMGEANRGRDSRVFDWDKAARMIREHKPKEAVAGLASDMEWTAGVIYRDGKIVDDEYTYLSSTWATPVLLLDDEEHDCFVMKSETTFDSGTKWPDTARAIVEGRD